MSTAHPGGWLITHFLRATPIASDHVTPEFTWAKQELDVPQRFGLRKGVRGDVVMHHYARLALISAARELQRISPNRDG
jgi:hypothetical protein